MPPITVNDKVVQYTTLLVGCLAIFTACHPSDPLFRRVPSAETGVTFANTITENDSFNVIDYNYVYNGGGVGVGDVNNDGLDDLFFTGNQVSSRLYLNQGDLAFQDVTQEAGVSTTRWATGVAMVDINQDGWLDIYVCAASNFDSTQSVNYFFINQGTDTPGGAVTFVDQAAAYGLADAGYSVQAAFLDYDLDGDLDMYLLTNGKETFSQNIARPRKTHGEGLSNDKLYRNDTPLPSSKSSGIPKDSKMLFTDVTREAGILTEGYGLGIAVNDVNQDGWPDVYAANDFIPNDLLWINNGNGTFTEKAAQYLKHQTHNGMGTDIADFNNDGLVDIMVLDMMPEDNFRQKMMFGKANDERFKLNLSYGYTPQYVRNTLQLNNGLTPQGEVSFSEIGQLAGVYQTDWSWSALFADFDNDGYRDLLVTNGYAKDVTDLDYVSYLSSSTQFGAHETKQERAMKLAALLKEAKVDNYVFKNKGDLTFEDTSAPWGMDTPSFSNGTAFADLDQDGDLDLVMNNINEEAFIYENTLEKTEENHYLRIHLIGPPANTAGLQTAVRLKYNGEQQYYYHSTYRGYQSTVENTIHFGLGAHPAVDSLEVTWPDGHYQLLQNVSANQVLTVRYEEATDSSPSPDTVYTPPLLTDISATLALDYQHREKDFVDFKYEPLLPRRYSQDGPNMAPGDINGDGRDDFYVGGAKDQPGRFFVQQSDGQFVVQLLPGDSLQEDMGAVLFDADGDGDQDLYVVSGGNEYSFNHPGYRDRFYRNDGQGSFAEDTTAIPALTVSGSCVRAADYDQDGDLDLFVGGRLNPKHYPLPVSSSILRNEAGRFVDVTPEVAPPLTDIGMVTDALWTDFDQDGQLDLLVVGEWMPITFLRQQEGRFMNVTQQTIAHTSGWWNSLVAGDFDQDGDPDYVVGNLGLNARYKASPTEPVSLYAKDYDQDGRMDPLLTYYTMGTEYSAAYRDALNDQMLLMRHRFQNYEAYASTPFDQLLTPEERQGEYVLRAERLTTSYLENQGNGTFTIRDMPIITQTAPVYAMATDDLNEDGHPDLLMVGNSYATEVQQGWYDAFIGQALLGDGAGHFFPLTMQQSGFYVDTDAKDLMRINQNGNPVWIVANNNDSLRIFASTQVLSPQEVAEK